MSFRRFIGSQDIREPRANNLDEQVLARATPCRHLAHDITLVLTPLALERLPSRFSQSECVPAFLFSLTPGQERLRRGRWSVYCARTSHVFGPQRDQLVDEGVGEYPRVALEATGKGLLLRAVAK